MKTLACYNIKGGVGKTATAVNLAWLAARDGSRTLLWDLDPQAAASFYFRIRPKVKGGAKALITRKRNLDSAIKGTDYDNLDLLPADFSYRNMDLDLCDVKKPGLRLFKLLKPLAGEYDLIVLDCPPGITLVSENILNGADRILVPTIPTTLSLRTLKQIILFCKEQKIDHEKLLVFFSMVDRRKSLHRMIIESPPEIKVQIAGSYIPYASEVEQMGLRRAPLGAFSSRCKAFQSYDALWQDLKNSLVG